jgi:hypothetical protein
MALPKNNWLRRLGGYACLLAVMLIYAPLGLLALWTGTGACCKSGYCPIPGHHRQAHSKADGEHNGMDCEHSAPGLAACTMSCCHDKEHALVAPVSFVLEESMAPRTTTLVARLAPTPPSKSIAQSFEPLSPPPRLAATA